VADNISITAGSGTSVAADDIGSVFYQRVKVSVGADGSAADLSTANPMPVSGSLVRVDTEFTRPANTTNYTAGDAVSNSTGATTIITLANAVRAVGASAYIVRVAVYTDKISITPRFRVHFYNASDATLAVDNAGFKELYTETAKHLGYVDLPNLVTARDTAASTMSTAANSSVRLPIVAGGATRDIYAALETLDAFAPNNAQKFMLSVHVDNN
jgi:hypothetical protein